MKRERWLYCIFSMCCFMLTQLAIYANAGPRGENEKIPIKVVRFERAPEIDGVLDNPIWSKAVPLESFTQFEPQEGRAPSEKTIAYIGYDDKNLYIAIKCFDANPKALRTNLTQRDRVMGDDIVRIYFDTYDDKKQAFVFQVNPSGIQTDGIFSESMGGRGRGGGGGGGGMGFFDRIDRNWDAYFKAAAKIDEDGYTIEMAIPFKSLRFPDTQTQKWGFQIQRNIPRKNEEIYLFPRSRSVNGFLIQFGQLEIEGPIAKGKNLEIMPVLTGLDRKTPDLHQKFKPEGSLNLKYGITSNMVVDATVNPDFSQIESDMPQIDVNQRYALYYPEKRPFFLEGRDYLNTPIELLYTRKLIDPAWGLKLSGKAGKTAIGFLSVWDSTPSGIDIPGGGSTGGTESRSFFNALRIRQDIYSESYIGFILTDKEMGLNGTPVTSDYNRVGGVDGSFKFLRFNRFSFQVVGSQSRVGEVRTEMAPAMTFNLNHNSRHLQISVDWSSIHPDFEATAGFIRRKDIHSFNSRLGYAFLPQNKYVISITPSFTYRRIYDYQWDKTDEDKEFSVFINGWRQTMAWVSYESAYEKYRGIGFNTWEMRMNLSSEPLGWIGGNVSRSFGNSIYYSSTPYLGYKTSWSARLNLKPLTNLRFLTTYTNNAFYKTRGGERVYRVNIISERISFQFSKPLSVRVITDYNDYYKKLFINFLISYELNPGTVFYIGMDNSRHEQTAGIIKKDRTFFVKFSYWWRV